MMQLMVDDLDAWWAHILSLDLPARFAVQPPRGPAVQPWGLRVAYLIDPCGMWHNGALGRLTTRWFRLADLSTGGSENKSEAAEQ